MPKLKVAFFFAQFIIVFNAIGQSNTLKKHTILEFYKEYVKTFQFPESGNRDSVLLFFSTSCLTNDLNRSELDFDPYIDAQDADSTLAETLKIRICRNDVATVTYGKNKNKRKIKMKWVCSGNKWLIDGIKAGRKLKFGCW